MENNSTTMQSVLEETIKNISEYNRDASMYHSVEKYFWIVFSPIFLFIGIIGNALNVFVLKRLNFQRNATYSLLVVLAFADMTVLVVGLTRYWIKYLADFDLRAVSDFSCKFSFFLIYFFMQFSSWILVLVTIIRFMKTFVPLKQSKYKDVTVKHTLLAVAVIGVCLTGINLHFFWTNGLVEEDGEISCTSLNDDYFFFDEHIFVYIDLMFLSIIPALIMVVFNTLICWELRKLTKTRRRMSLQSGVSKTNKQTSTKKVTWMLLITTSYFIVATIPICIYFIVDTHIRPDADALTKGRLDLAWTFTYLFQFSHFALNFYLYTATNKKFRRELQRLTHNMYQRVSTSSQSAKAQPREYSSDSKKMSATATPST